MRSTPVRLAAIDLDGTLLDGQSQELFVRYLVRERAASLWLLAYVVLTFVLYKSGRRLDFGTIQRRIVASFTNQSALRIDELLDDFVASDVVRRLRPEGRTEIASLIAAGARVILVSGAIQPLAERVGAHLGAADVVATKLVPPCGDRFSGRIDGEMVLGPAKLSAFRQHADKAFGSGQWHLWRAYGDHEADLDLLESAEEPIAVCPTPALRAIAAARGWRTASWR